MKRKKRAHSIIRIFLLSSVLLSLPGYSQNCRKVFLQVEPMFGSQQLKLETQTYPTGNGDTVSVIRFRFYLSAIRFIFSDGSEFSEKNSYHLVDAEDQSTLSIALSDVPPKEIKTIAFMIGVDSLASVSGALDGDLDPVKGMYWAWNSGYINAKLEGRTKGNKEYEFHVGGYLPPYQAIRSVKLDVPGNTINKISIAADVQHWFRNIRLDKMNRIVMPGAEAIKMADDYTSMFSIKK